MEGLGAIFRSDIISFVKLVWGTGIEKQRKGNRLGG